MLIYSFHPFGGRSVPLLPKIAFWAILGVKMGVLRPQSVTIFIFLYENNNNVLQLTFATCSYMVFIPLVDVLCRYCQKIAFLGNFGDQNGGFTARECYYFHIFV